MGWGGGTRDRSKVTIKMEIEHRSFGDGVVISRKTMCAF